MKAHLKKNILKMKAHHETHFENENCFWKSLQCGQGERREEALANAF